MAIAASALINIFAFSNVSKPYAFRTLTTSHHTLIKTSYTDSYYYISLPVLYIGHLLTMPAFIHLDKCLSVLVALCFSYHRNSSDNYDR